MDLILIRHAKAHERDALSWPDDARRPLTEDGIRDFRRLAKRLGRLVPAVELVESSGFERAWATAEILRVRAGWPAPRRMDRLEPGDDDGAGLGRLQALARSVAAMRTLRTLVWVGHEPMLSRLAALLLAGSPDALSIDFAKGAALALQLDLPPDIATPPDPSSVIGRARLLWMLNPRMVRRMR